jgi:hypothetical protein
MNTITVFVVLCIVAVGALLAAMGGVGVALAFWFVAAAGALGVVRVMKVTPWLSPKTA